MCTYRDLAVECGKLRNDAVVDLDVDDLPSTAASSVVHSPNGGPEGAPGDALDEAILDSALDESVLGKFLDECLSAADPPMFLRSLPPLPGSAFIEAPVDSAEQGQIELRCRIEQLFESAHLSHDFYLRSRMDELGWVDLCDVLQLAGLDFAHSTVQEGAEAVAESQSLELSNCRQKVRAKDSAIQAAFAPRRVTEPFGACSPVHAHVGIIEFVPELDIADEDLTIAASIEPDDVDMEDLSRDELPRPCQKDGRRRRRRCWRKQK
mmetsp:Transcript_40652/g.73220  ORF Transcript_40652/g.73220 Transcript_40652/m.73220 type:complete len:265 (-) Transcript_40652:43-837(-)